MSSKMNHPKYNIVWIINFFARSLTGWLFFATKKLLYNTLGSTKQMATYIQLNISEQKITINARGTHIIVYKTHPIFTMSDFLKAAPNFNFNNPIIDVNVNPNSLQVLIDYAECREALEAEEQLKAEEAGDIIQIFLPKIFSDGALCWAVRALKMDLGAEKPAELGAEKPAEMWTLNQNISVRILGCIVNMEGSWTFIQAVAIIALLLKEHLFQGFGIKVDQANDTTNGKLPSDNMIQPGDTDNRECRFLPLLLTITHNDDKMLIKFGDQKMYHNGQMRNDYFVFEDYNNGRILDQLVPKPEFAPFIEKLKEYLNIYTDISSRHF